jgi:hypothetical protein
MAQLPSPRRIHETSGLPEMSQYDKLSRDAECLSYEALPRGNIISHSHQLLPERKIKLRMVGIRRVKNVTYKKTRFNSTRGTLNITLRSLTSKCLSALISFYDLVQRFEGRTTTACKLCST